MNRLTILKTSWGIAIFYEIKEIENFNKDEENVHQINSQIFLKLNDIILDNISLEYLKKGIQSIAKYVKKTICFSIDELEFNICDYQPEGMYYVFRKWFFEKHNMETPPINVYYDSETNKYIFPDLSLGKESDCNDF